MNLKLWRPTRVHLQTGEASNPFRDQMFGTIRALIAKRRAREMEKLVTAFTPGFLKDEP